MPRPAGLDSAYRRGMPSAATAVYLYDEGDGSVEMRLELLARPEPARGSGSQSGLMPQSLPSGDNHPSSLLQFGESAKDVSRAPG
jgi:hypothetical protein